MLIECHNSKCANHFRDHTCMLTQLAESGCNERKDRYGDTPDFRSPYSVKPRIHFEIEMKESAGI